MRLALAVVVVFHGSQKPFGWFGGNGLDAEASYKASLGLSLGRLYATLAGSTELAAGTPRRP